MAFLFLMKGHSCMISVGDSRLQLASVLYHLPFTTRLLPLLRRTRSLLPWTGTRPWAGSLLPVCDITFPSIHPWKYVHIWLHFLLTAGAIPCRHFIPILWVCVCVTEEGGSWQSSFTLQGRQTWPLLQMFTGAALVHLSPSVKDWKPAGH